MGAWRRPGLIDEFHRRLIDGMRLRGLSDDYAEAVFQQIRGFGDYGFPESHAASFALLVYVSAWLKYHYQAAFTASLLNSQPMGFYAPAQLVRNARDHGVEVRPVDVNASQWDCTLEAIQNSEVGIRNDAACGLALRLGLRMLNGMRRANAEQIVASRADRPYVSIDDFARRTGLGKAAIAQLARAGVFKSLNVDRRGALWNALAQDKRDLPLFDGLDAEDSPPAELPPLSPAEEVLADYRTQGMSLSAHPLSFLRGELDRMHAVRAAELASLPDGETVRVAGIVLVRQRPGTAKGITFVTLEDETGQANLIIRPDVWQHYRHAALGATLLLAHGRLQNQSGVIHVLTTKLENLTDRLEGLDSPSRDFC
jgi:error-prone DNA polymerase